jgi:hypothetical protein
MKRAFLIIALIFLSIPCSFAQKEYKPAYIITNNYDTINGLVNISTDIRSSGICLFKLNSVSDPVKYKPEDLIGYRLLNDRYFVSKEILIAGKPEKRFLEYIINGIVSIYSYTSTDGVRYFAQKEGEDRLIELIDREKEIYVNGVSYSKTDKQYVGTLKVLMQDATGMMSDIDKISFGRKSLVNISIEYHNSVCTDHNCIIYEKKPEKPLIELGVAAGYNFAEMHGSREIISSHNYILAVFDGEFTKSEGLTFGFSLRCFIPGFDEKFYLKYEALVVKHEFGTTYYNYTISGKEYGTFTSYHMYNNFNAGFYLFNCKIRPVIEAGGLFCHSLSSEYKGFNNITGGPVKDVNLFGLSVAGGVSIKLWSGYHVDLMAEARKSFSAYDCFNINDINLKINIPVVSFNKKTHINN